MERYRCKPGISCTNGKFFQLIMFLPCNINVIYYNIPGSDAYCISTCIASGTSFKYLTTLPAIMIHEYLVSLHVLFDFYSSKVNITDLFSYFGVSICVFSRHAIIFYFILFYFVFAPSGWNIYALLRFIAQSD